MVKLTEDYAKELVGQIRRATRMPIADAEERHLRRKEFGEELLRVARSRDHAEEIARRCRESFDDFPTIHQLHQIACACLREELEKVELGEPGCKRCSGTGWQPSVIVASGSRYSAVKVCGCRKSA